MRKLSTYCIYYSINYKLGAPDLVPKIRYTSESDRYNLSYLNLWHWQPGVVFANDVCSVIMPRSKELSEAFGKKMLLSAAFEIPMCTKLWRFQTIYPGLSKNCKTSLKGALAAASVSACVYNRIFHKLNLPGKGFCQWTYKQITGLCGRETIQR